jgi:hypothetical protein
MRFRWRTFIFLGFTVAALLCMLLFPRIPQPLDYHRFADFRQIAGIPNLLNVISNLLFVIAGLWGLGLTVPRRQRKAFLEMSERWPYVVFFLGILLTGFGSAYYHFSPDNETLVWDRLPMAVSFMGILAGILGDRVGPRIGRLFLAPALALGIFSVLYWHCTEIRGAGDLRPYIIVQFYTIAAVFLLMLLFPARYTHAGWLVAAGGAYVLAKILESTDWPVYDVLKISGHTLKHVFAATAAFCIILMLKKRTTIEIP